jgi:hypothetical protein
MRRSAPHAESNDTLLYANLVLRLRALGLAKRASLRMTKREHGYERITGIGSVKRSAFAGHI